MEPKKLCFVATDKPHDCLRCYFQSQMYDAGCDKKCNEMAKEMGVPYTYAILEHTPEVEYYGG